MPDVPMLRPPGRNVDLHYELRGEGPPLLLLMGWRGNLDWWPPPLLEAMEKRHRLILVDNRGGGDTGDPGGRFTMPQMADDAAALVTSLGFASADARVDVFGVSMGGMIAQELVLRHPALVGKLVLACTHSGRRAGVRPSAAMLRAWGKGLMRPWRIDENLVHLLFSAPGGVDKQLLAEFRKMAARAPMRAWPSAKQYLAILGHDTYDRLPGIEAPTLVVTGDDDLMVAPGHSEALARRIPGARLVRFPATGHALLRTRAAELDALLEEFLCSS